MKTRFKKRKACEKIKRKNTPASQCCRKNESCMDKMPGRACVQQFLQVLLTWDRWRREDRQARHDLVQGSSRMGGALLTYLPQSWGFLDGKTPLTGRCP